MYTSCERTRILQASMSKYALFGNGSENQELEHECNTPQNTYMHEIGNTCSSDRDAQFYSFWLVAVMAQPPGSKIRI